MHYFSHTMEVAILSEINVILYEGPTDREDSIKDFISVFKAQPDFEISNRIFIKKGSETKYYKKGHYSLLIHGDIYNESKTGDSYYDTIIERLTNHSSLHEINGSFVVLLVDESSNDITIITDRINTKKIFLYKKDEKTVLTTNPCYLKKIGNEVNVGAIANYLINGVLLNNETLYDGLRVLERACSHNLANGRLESKPYWEYKFTNEFAYIPRNELRKTFADLLIQSVERRIKAIKPENCFLSLSGGYDSRFLLGALRLFSNDFHLKTFSYGMSDKLINGDDLIAVRLAEKFHLKHFLENAYSNDFLRTVNLNAAFGYGFPNFCSEIDVWLNLRERFSAKPSSLLFVGDMYYLPSHNFGTIRDKRLLLMYSSVFHWTYIKPLLAVLPETNQEQLVTAYDKIYKNILLRLPDTNDFQVSKDFAYLDQRISHTLMYWRELFIAPFIKVTQPLLDNDLLDFIRKLPNELRYDKILYKETLHEMFPDLFSIPIAQNIWANPSWIDEIENNRDAIVNELNTTNSRLDPLIPPETIKMLINNDNKVKRIFKMSKAAGIARKLSRKNDLLNNLLGNIVINNTHVKRNQLIISILMLRKSLQVK